MYKNVLRFIGKRFRENRLLASFTLFFVFIGRLLETSLSLGYKKFFDALQPDTPYRDILNILLVIAGVWFASEVGYRIANLMDNEFQKRSIKKSYTESYNHLLDRSYHFFSNRFVGEIVKQVMKLARGFEDFWETFLWNIFTITIECFVSLVLMYQVSPFFSLIMAVFIVFTVGGNILFIRYIAPLEDIHNRNESKVSGLIADTISNIFTIKIFSQKEKEQDSFQKYSHRSVNSLVKIWNISAIRWSTQNILNILCQFFVLLLALSFWKAGRISIGDIVMIQTLFMSIGFNTWTIGRNIQNCNTALSDMKEMVDILGTPHDLVESTDATPLSVTEGKIEIKDLHFGYESGKNVFKNLSLTIKPGEKIALVSRSGGGKSTLVKLLLRLYDVPANTILIDGQDIREVSQNSLRKYLGMVPQDITLFHRSLRDNIAYAKPDASLEEIIEASKLAHAHEFISKLPEGYDTFVGERGIKLSGGERQRVAIARAILKNAPILILDEATSSLDSQSEALIQKALHKVMEGKTSIVIAHRLSTIMQMDRIIVIEEGKITEEGTHSELIQKKGSHYKELWEIQSKGFQEK